MQCLPLKGKQSVFSHMGHISQYFTAQVQDSKHTKHTQSSPCGHSQHSEPAVPVALLPRSEPTPSIPTDAIYSQARAEHKVSLLRLNS